MNLNKYALAAFLSSRMVLMVCLQGCLALLFIHHTNPFERAGWYWATHLTLVNLFLLVLMRSKLKKTGDTYSGLFKRFNRQNTVFFAKIVVPLILVAVIPNMVLSIALYQDIQIGTTFLLGAIPWFFIIPNITVFPVLQGLVELPFYFAFIMPQLKKITTHKFIYLGIPVFFLSVQHAFMPLRLEAVYVLYRSLMFVPFALVVGLLLHKKPTLLVYLVIVHVLMNASLFMMMLIP